MYFEFILEIYTKLKAIYTTNVDIITSITTLSIQSGTARNRNNGTNDKDFSCSK